MNTAMSGRRGVLVYAGVAILGVTAVSALHSVMNLSAGDRRAGAIIMAAMWIPTLARFVASRTVDRDWSPPFPLRRYGTAGWLVWLLAGPVPLLQALS